MSRGIERIKNVEGIPSSGLRPPSPQGEGKNTAPQGEGKNTAPQGDWKSLVSVITGWHDPE
ncbi:MAG TPA: hypothetical protein DD473_05130 [Planctomycetaceae bacterium]|nr:hypothetical protein [Planctomycetaceae bacterium]